MTTVTIKQNKESTDLTIDGTLGGKTKRLLPDSEVAYEVDDGTRHLTLIAVSPSTGNTSFRLDFNNAERPNGNPFIKDTGYNGYRRKFRMHVPKVG